MKFNPVLQKEVEEREIKKINDYPETRCVRLHLHMYAKDISEKK